VTPQSYATANYGANRPFLIAECEQGVNGPLDRLFAQANTTGMRAKIIGTADAAARLGVTMRRVQILCEQGRIPGAQRIGRTWAIPMNFRVKPPKG